jgi:mTERF domain-containing protein
LAGGVLLVAAPPLRSCARRRARAMLAGEVSAPHRAPAGGAAGVLRAAVSRGGSSTTRPAARRPRGCRPCSAAAAGGAGVTRVAAAAAPPLAAAPVGGELSHAELPALPAAPSRRSKAAESAPPSEPPPRKPRKPRAVAVKAAVSPPAPAPAERAALAAAAAPHSAAPDVGAPSADLYAALLLAERKPRKPRASTSAAAKAARAAAAALPPGELLLPPAPRLLLPPSAADDALSEADSDGPEGDELDPDDLDYGPPSVLPSGGAAGASSPLAALGGAGRALGARDWQAVMDWQLMGFEHEAIPDGDFAALLKRVKGLKEAWRPMVSYLYSLGLRETELARLASKEPQIFEGNVGRARSRVAFLQSSFSLTAAELVRVLEVAPRVMFLRIERTLQKRLAFLESLGVPHDKLGHIVSRAPTLLYTTSATLEPRVEYLCYVLKLAREDVGRMVVRHPKMLTNNESMLESRLLFLFQLGLNDDAVRRMVLSHPQLLNYTPESMTPRVEWLMDEVGMDADEVVRTVTKLSQLFSLSVDKSLRPKYQYLTCELGGSKQTLLDCPTYLSLSLAARIVPRHLFLKARGRAATPFNVWEFIHADPRFAKSAAATLDEWAAFRDAHVARHGAETASRLADAEQALRLGR